MSCYKYWDKLLEVSHDLGDYSYPIENPDKVIPLLDSVEVIAHDKEIDFDSAKHIFENKTMVDALNKIRKFYVTMGASLERDNALSIINAENPIEKMKEFHFYERYEMLIANEQSMIHLNEGQKLVFIGGGPLPLTLIMFNKLYNIKGISVEIQPEIADISRKMLKKIGLDNEIEVLTGDETIIKDLTDYDTIMIAAFAVPKERVFQNVRKYSKSNVPIMYRTYSGMRKILYEPIDDNAFKGYKEKERKLPPGKVNNTSVLLEKIEN